MFLQDFMAKNWFFDIFTSFSLEHGPFFSKWWPSEENAKKIIFFCRNGLYPCWYKIYQEAMRFWKLFGFLVHPSPQSIATWWHNWWKISLLQLCCFKCIYPLFPSLPSIEFQISISEMKAVSENVMGVAVLQLYPVQDNRTGPQVVELLTKRIVNQG